MDSTKPSLIDDCFLHDKDRMRHNEALALLKERLSCIAQPISTKLDKASGNILAENIHASRNIPASDNSAVDGYAFNFRDYETSNEMQIIGRVAAGNKQIVSIEKNIAIRIFTGAPMPQYADTVAMQEDCKIIQKNRADFVIIPAGLKKGANKRKAGEDVSKGEIIAKSGTRLTPQIMAAIASTGLYELKIFKPLNIALISSGNELLRPNASNQNPSNEQSFDTNHTMLDTMLKALNIKVVDYGVLTDDFELIESTLKKAATECDVIITTGGASKGEEDHIIPVLEKIGKMHLWQLAVKPGRPMSFGQINKTPFFGLPGNPVAAFVCFSLYVRQALLILNGANYSEPARYLIPSGFNFENKKPDRREFWRGSMVQNDDGTVTLQKYKKDGSGMISSLRQSTGLIEISEEIIQIKKGDLLPFIPFNEFN